MALSYCGPPTISISVMIGVYGNIVEFDSPLTRTESDNILPLVLAEYAPFGLELLSVSVQLLHLCLLLILKYSQCPQ